MDLTDYDLSNDYEKLLYANFDSNTKWPKSLPEDFNPEKIMELYKDPGLGVRELHKKGITGKNVGIAIFDQQLLVDQVEYKDRLKYYDEIDDTSLPASMHSCAVASIACGKTTGVAPEADLYFLEANPVRKENKEIIEDYRAIAEGIQKIIELNKTLPSGRKIRVISISKGFTQGNPGYTKFTAAVEEAEKNNILVLTTLGIEVAMSISREVECNSIGTRRKVVLKHVIDPTALIEALK